MSCRDVSFPGPFLTSSAGLARPASPAPRTVSNQPASSQPGAAAGQPISSAPRAAESSTPQLMNSSVRSAGVLS